MANLKDTLVLGKLTATDSVVANKNLLAKQLILQGGDKGGRIELLAAMNDTTGKGIIFNVLNSALKIESSAPLGETTDYGTLTISPRDKKITGGYAFDGSAAKLTTPRKINGTNFDGSANITTAAWGTARTISINSSAGTTGTSVNGSSNVSLIIPTDINGFTSISSNALYLNSGTNAADRGLIIRRGDDNKESLRVGVNDANAVFTYTNDETTSAFIFTLINTDTESGSGTGSSTVSAYIKSNGSKSIIESDIFRGVFDGNATSATVFNSARTIKLTGDVSGSVASTGADGWSITTTVADNSHKHTSSNISDLSTVKSNWLKEAQEYTDTGISNLVGSAPEALNTLAELAAALNNNPDIMSGIIDNINTKVAKAGDTMTGSLTFATSNAIKYKGTKATKTMINFIDNPLDSNGNGIVIGGGGSVYIGSGESAAGLYNILDLNEDEVQHSGGVEVMRIGGDNHIEFYSGCNTIANRKLTTYNSSGNWIMPNQLMVGGALYVNNSSLVSGDGETASMKIKTSNGGAIIFGKEGPNSGTMIRLDQADGTCRLRFRASTTAGAMVWEQPEKNAALHMDLGDSTGAAKRVSFQTTAPASSSAIYANLNITGNAATATKLGTANKGSAINPIYLNGGTPTPCNVAASGNYKSFVPCVSSSGVMEIGQYIDMHTTDSSADHDVRLQIADISPTSGTHDYALKVSKSITTNSSVIAQYFKLTNNSSTVKATYQYNTTDDCLELVFS